MANWPLWRKTFSVRGAHSFQRGEDGYGQGGGYIRVGGKLHVVVRVIACQGVYDSYRGNPYVGKPPIRMCVCVHMGG